MTGPIQYCLVTRPTRGTSGWMLRTEHEPNQRTRMLTHSAHSLGPAKTYIPRGTQRTYAIKTRRLTDNWTITDGPVRGTEGPETGTGPL